MSVRRAYNIVRQTVDSSRRLTFEEFAILCHLDAAGAPVKTSDIAVYQGALRPTMTHRTNHLSSLGYIDRSEGSVDRRNVVCSISDSGREAADELCCLTCSQIPTGRSLSRTSPDRIRKYVDAMGGLFCKAGDLVLLGVYDSDEDSLTIMQLVGALGLLQPTVSMSVTSLEEEGLVHRAHGVGGAHTTSVGLTEAGEARVSELIEGIEQLVVRRRPRQKRREAVGER